MQSPNDTPSTPRPHPGSPTHPRTSRFLSPTASTLATPSAGVGLGTRTPFSTPRGPLTPPDSSNAKARALAHALAGEAGAAPIDLGALKAAAPDSPLAQRGQRAFNDPAVVQAGIALAGITPSSTLSSMPSMTFSDAGAGGMSASSSVATDVSGGDGEKTPNVYINGLPPNFPEEQLFQMTREFGAVSSVRTFTRHVADRPSGYGFVLFESVDSAEKCIESLRKFRNLHPSFSKQLHKIPGTAYANVPAAAARSAAVADPTCFKAKMERLKDESSTNLYMEGLPLSIDEPTLAALVAPNTIKSSRFFQTKLSHPPRIIAFVRLESRKACEEVIELLHGRMVRGWNDSGSRISVRFADSNGQRELRRTERQTRDVEPNSPAKLTMAQAALLNLRGGMSPIPSPVFSPSMSLPTMSPSQEYAFSPYINTSPSLSVPVAMTGAPATQSRLPQHPLIAPYQQAPTPTPVPSLQSAHPGLDPHMATLLETLQNASLNDRARAAAAPKYHGFTQIEQQLILQAQAQQQVLEAQRKALEVQQQMLALEAQREALRVQEQARLAMQQQQQQQQQQQHKQHQSRAPVNSGFAPIDLVPPMIRPAQVQAHAQAAQQAHARTRTTTNSARFASADGSQQDATASPTFLHTRSTTLPSSHRASAAGSNSVPSAAPSTMKAPTPTAPTAPAVKIQVASPAVAAPASDNVDSPLVSPALTYSSRGSPSASSTATLSPMTPAFVPGQLNGFVAPAAATPAKATEGTPVVGLGVDMCGPNVASTGAQ